MNNTLCLSYLNNRYYDPTLGTFTSVDPLVGKTGTPYLYANGNPTTLSDPSGLDACKSITCDSGQVQGPKCAHASGANPCGGIPLEISGYPNFYNDKIKSDQEEWRRKHLTDETRLRLEEQARNNRRAPGPRPPEDELPRLFADVLTGFDQGHEGGGLGVCGGVSASAGVWGGGQSCIVADTDGIWSTTTLAYGVTIGSPGVSGDAGVMVSNADAKDLGAWSVCGSAAGGAGVGGSGSICGSVYLDADTGQWEYSGAWAIYGSVQLTTPQGGWTYSAAYTWNDQWIDWPTPPWDWF